MAHSFMEFRKTLPSAAAPTKMGIAMRWQVESSPPGRDSAFVLAVEGPQAIAQLGAGHLALELRAQQDGGEEFVLVQQHVLMEGHVGDANGMLVAQGAVVAPDGNFEDGPGHRRVRVGRLRWPS